MRQRNLRWAQGCCCADRTEAQAAETKALPAPLASREVGPHPLQVNEKAQDSGPTAAQSAQALQPQSAAGRPPCRPKAPPSPHHSAHPRPCETARRERHARRAGTTDSKQGPALPLPQPPTLLAAAESKHSGYVRRRVPIATQTRPPPARSAACAPAEPPSPPTECSAVCSSAPPRSPRKGVASSSSAPVEGLDGVPQRHDAARANRACEQGTAAW